MSNIKGLSIMMQNFLHSNLKPNQKTYSITPRTPFLQLFRLLVFITKTSAARPDEGLDRAELSYGRREKTNQKKEEQNYDKIIASILL